MKKFAALGVCAFVLFAPLGAGGIWDPPELAIAEFGRRVAIHTLGGSGLVLPAADNSMPTLGDLGKNELPVDSIALGFRLFGLHEWAGRLPLALWAFLGVLALWFCLTRLVDGKASAYGATMLATMPLYFVHARTMLGDAVTMAGVAIAFAGLAVGAFDDPSRGDRVRVGAGALGLAALGFVVAFFARGALAVTVPALAVGVAWGLGRAAGRQADGVGRIAGVGALAIGTASAAGAWWAAAHTTSGAHSVLLGTTVLAPGALPTFDSSIHALGHGLFPWSAFLPFAAARLFATPEAARESVFRVALLVGAALALAAHALALPCTGQLPFAGIVFFAAIGAVALRDLEKSGHRSRMTAIGVALLTVVLLFDFDTMPEKALSPFALARAATFPEGFRHEAKIILRAGSSLFAVAFFLGFAWDERGPWRFARLPRVMAIAWGGVLAALIFALGYYPRLAAQLSPKEAFVAHAHLQRGGEELGVLGLGAAASSYGAARATKRLDDADGALRWLTENNQRRWLVARREDIARLNSLYRAGSGCEKNLPILEARSSNILLASNLLLEGETNQNPFLSVVLATAPAPAHPLDATLENQLVALGWDIWDAKTGRSADTVVTSHRYRFRIYWRVLATPTREWETFLHVDGPQRRFNGDHKTLGGAYAMSLWQPGDYVVDEHEISLPLNFTAGDYEVFFGLYSGDHRMKVTAGRSDSDRIDGGSLRVR